MAHTETRTAFSIRSALVLLSILPSIIGFEHVSAYEQSCLSRLAVIDRLALSPDGKDVAANWDIGTARLWDINSGKLIQTYALGTQDFVTGIDFSQDGQFIVLTSEDKAVIWNTQTGKEVKTFVHDKTANNYPIYTIRARFTPDGKKLLTAGTFGIIVWDIASGQKLHEFSGSLPIDNIGFNWMSPDGNHVVLLQSESTNWQVWSTAGVLEHQFDNVNYANFSLDSGSIITDAENVDVWRIPSFENKFSLHLTSSSWYEVSPNAKFMFIAAPIGTPQDKPQDYSLELWNTTLDSKLQTLRVPSSVRSFRTIFRPDNATYIIVEQYGYQSEISLNGINTNKNISRFSIDEFIESTKPFLFVPHTDDVLLGSIKGYIDLIDLRTGSLKMRFC